MEYHYRFLNESEYPVLKQVFETQGFGPMPAPGLSAIAVAQDENGVIKGFLVMQLVPHAEPLWIAPDARGGVFAQTLIGMIEKASKDMGCKVLVSTESPNQNVNRFAELNKMQNVAGSVFVKRL